MATLERFLDEEGRLKQLPSKSGLRQEAFSYLSGKFEKDRKYTEKEVNQIVTDWSTIGDYFILRRGLIEYGLMSRLADGSQYWLNKTEEE